jgi:CheY-like chemotaxis protein
MQMAIPSRREVLIVEDDSSVRDSVATLLLSAGYDVAAAADGFEALVHLRKTIPDVIVSDLNMPQMSGYELLSIVRRRFPEIITVAMSGDYQGDTVPHGVIADSFFAKGQSPRNLLLVIAELVRTLESCVRTHYEEITPAWIPRNGNNAQGDPCVMVSCAECLRTFQLAVTEETAGAVLEAPCRFCPCKNRYILEPLDTGRQNYSA